MATTTEKKESGRFERNLLMQQPCMAAAVDWRKLLSYEQQARWPILEQHDI